MIHPHSQAYHLLGLIAVCGELPADAIHRLPISESYRYKVIASLKSQKLIRLFGRDGIKGYRLTPVAKKLLLQTQPDRFSYYLDAGRVSCRSEPSRRRRLHAAAQTYITMIRAGVPLFYDEKAPIFEPSLSAAVPKPSGAVFYCPTEVKDIGLEAAKIRSSRVAGILFDDERIYLTYNTGNAVMKWETRAELRLLSLVESRFCRNPARAWYSDKNVIGLMLGDSMDTALLLLGSTGGYKRSGYRTDTGFARFWFCPHTPEGERQLQILTSPIYAQLCRLLLSDLRTGVPPVSIDCDALDTEGRPVLLSLCFDIPRIKRFRDALELFGYTGRIFCFDFQAPVLQIYMGGLADIQPVSLEKVVKEFHIQT